MGDTKEIAAILTGRNPQKYKAIIERAALNGYHDFKFDQIPGHPEYAEAICPKMQLVKDLAAYPELEDIRNRVMNGDFDEQGDAEDAEYLKNMLLSENAPDAMFKLMGLPIPDQADRFLHEKKKKFN